MNFLRWSGSHIRWGQAFRLRHITTGKYLSLLDDKSLLLTDKEKADVKSTAFCFRSSKVWNQCSINVTSSNSNLFSEEDCHLKLFACLAHNECEKISLCSCMHRIKTFYKEHILLEKICPVAQ